MNAKHFVNGVSLYKHLQATGRMNEYSRIRKRVAKGMTIEAAMSTAKRTYDVIPPRLRETWSLLGKGYCDKEIAREMGIAVGTVKEQMRHLMQRTGARNRIVAALKFHGISV